MGCLGNGITVCNKAVKEHGNYKVIAHIRDTGQIKWYVNCLSYVPVESLLKIEHSANVQYEQWKKWFDSMTEYKQYEYLLDNVSVAIMLEVFKMECSLAEKIDFLKQEYFKSQL